MSGSVQKLKYMAVAVLLCVMAFFLPFREAAAGERLSEFSEFVWDLGLEAEEADNGEKQEKAGTQGSVSKNEEDKRLEEFAAIAGEDDGRGENNLEGSVNIDDEDGGRESKRLEEFAAIANEYEDGDGERLKEFAAIANEYGDGGDERLREFAALADGMGQGEDSRMEELSRLAEEREEELTKKYGPLREDKVVQTENSLQRDGWEKEREEKEKRDDEKEDRTIVNERIRSIIDRIEEAEREKRLEDDPYLEEAFEAGAGREGRGVALGTFKLTAYDACVLCCGKTDGITATGTKAEVGRTVAVDPELIPFGSRVMINGHIYTAEDSGSKIKGKVIDIFSHTHEEAKRFGVKYAEVYLLD